MDMQVQSKMNSILNQHDFFKNNVILKSYKVYELKNIAKKYKLYVTGTKTVLINRITEYFIKVKGITKIQSIIRRHIILNMMILKGPALKNRKICTNETDFYTLEPLNNLDYYDFFSYKDEEGFTYGFDINSLITLLRKKSIIHNPYNRKQIQFNIIRNISVISKLNRQIHKINNDSFNSEQTIREQTIEKMNVIRNKNILQRIHDLFYEIDLLGNYTSESWFNDLSIEEYVTFLRQMWDIWNIRSNMPIITRKRICPYFNPFIEGVNNINISEHAIRDNEGMKKTCVTIMENLIYTGINEDFKQLAAILVLTALTYVSQPAREQLPWLYESLQ
tara:strand:+ start:13444 stop:14445 length:1002 start_codon:yes stop_codon:yes gene_type:complete